MAYVNERTQTYIADIEERESAGSPNVLAAARAAYAHTLLATLTPEAVEAAGLRHCRRALAAWRQCNAIHVVGEDRLAMDAAHRSPVLSFNMIAAKTNGGYCLLPPNFVAAVLNDVYGIQVWSPGRLAMYIVIVVKTALGTSSCASLTCGT